MARHLLDILLYLVAVLFILPTTKSQAVDYYWRDYDGEIPDDALSAGQDANGKDIFIGQIYVHKFGLFIGTIFQGKKEIEFSCYGIMKTDNSSIVKILCTDHEKNFSWLPTTSKTLHVDTIGKYAVIGGYNGKKIGTANIGRVMHEGSAQVGAIGSFNVGSAYFYFVYNNIHHVDIENYEVLIYNDVPNFGIKPRTQTE